MDFAVDAGSASTLHYDPDLLGPSSPRYDLKFDESYPLQDRGVPLAGFRRAQY
jgi:hypothetical protein